MKKKMMPLFLILLILTIPIFSLTAVYGTNDIVDIFINQVKILVNGENTDMPSLLYDNKTYVPLREICDSLGIKLTWDSKTNTALLSSGKSMASTILYIFSKALEISGILLIGQIVFGRMKKDFYFVRKFNSSHTSMKRLIYSSSTIRIGFYYVVLGIIIGFLASNPTPTLLSKLLILPLITAVLWFLGMCIANAVSKKEQAEFLNSANEN